MVASALLMLIRISGLLCSSSVQFSSWFHRSNAGILTSFSKVSVHYHQCGHYKSLYCNVIMIITPHSFTCKISPEATSELAASPKHHMGTYSITSVALSSHRDAEHTQSQCRISFPSNVWS